MKMKLLIISFAMLLSLNNVFAEKLRTHTTSGTCPTGSVNDRWSATWTYNQKGQPVTGAGIDCDGNPWSKDFRISYPGNTSISIENVIANISTINPSIIQVVAKESVKFRIVNIQTGSWVSDEIIYTVPDIMIDIDIHDLSNGNYGLVVILENTVIDMIQFIK